MPDFSLPNISLNEALSDSEYEWRKKTTNETPNGKLLVQNVLFDNLKKSSEIYLAHVTTNFEEILTSGTLFSSSGCLLGGIYTFPLFDESEGLRVHNLGKYIIDKEAPRISYLKNRNEPNILIIKIILPKSDHNHLIGLDYTRLGNVHLDIYREFENYLLPQEKYKFRHTILNRIKSSVGLIDLMNKLYEGNSKIAPDSFFNYYIDAINSLPFLGYLYFEAVSEFIMLYQDFKGANVAHALGEFYNHSYKDLMFDLFPELLYGRGLNIFKPTLKQLSGYLKEKQIISRLEQGEISNYLMNRLVLLVNNCLLNGNLRLMNWGDLKFEFDRVAETAPSLIGHIIHRELKNHRLGPDFDQLEAIQVWNYWNKIGAVMPLKGFIPKGEIAINPAYPALRYQIYSGSPKRHGDNLYILPDEKLNIRITPQLVHRRYIAMHL